MPPAEHAAAPSPGARALDGLARGRTLAVRGAVAAADRPLAALGALVGLHLVALVAFALTVRHNGLVFYQGGDQIGLTTDAWLLGRGHLPPTVLGFGWPLVLLPFGWLAAPDYVAYLPWVIGLNALVLAPIAIWCVFTLGSRIGGRVLGLWAALLWVAGPYLAIPFFRADYHERYVEQFLPQALGLVALADYPSTVCLLGAAVLGVRALDARDPGWAVLAGLVSGFAVGMKPSNAIFLAAPAVLWLLARQPRLVVAYGAGVVPFLVLLTAWKARGLGDLPLFALREAHVAAGDRSRRRDRRQPLPRSRLGEPPPEHGEPARVLLERPPAPVAPAGGRVRGRAALAAPRGAPGDVVRGLSRAQGDGSAVDGRERQLLPAPPPGRAGLRPPRGLAAAARAGRSCGASRPGCCLRRFGRSVGVSSS